VKHLTSLIAFLIHELVANGKQAREAVLNNGIKLGSFLVVVRLVSECSANGQQTLKPSQD
jgi:hypothetical protein